MDALTRPEDAIDFRQPDYLALIEARVERLARLRADPQLWAWSRAYYREHIADFISDWGVTFDPRVISAGRSAHLPFVLQLKQRQMVEWIIERWKKSESGIIEKSRDTGVSWICMSVAIALCTLYDGMSIGFGSATKAKLDRSGDPDSLFFKGRMFVAGLPPEFRAGCDIELNAPDERILFPATGSSITGEVGDNIGRGGRKALYFVDEAAFIEHPKLMESALSGTTDCRIDVSSVSLQGMDNEFAIRRHSGRVPVFTLHYRDDLRRDAAWAAKKEASLDPVVWAADYEIDYTGAAKGVIIESAWVRAAIDAHLALPKEDWAGTRWGALDIADEGLNLNAFAARHGNQIIECRRWSGKGSELQQTVERAFELCDEFRLEGFDYDADGGGAHARGPARQIAERRGLKNYRPVRVNAFRGSSSVFDPERKAPGTDVKNEDRYHNAKAQGYGSLAGRFRNTYSAVKGLPYDKTQLISLSSSITELNKLCIELARPRWKIATTGKLLVDKLGDSALSPDLADALMMVMAPKHLPMRINRSLLRDPRNPYGPA